MSLYDEGYDSYTVLLIWINTLRTTAVNTHDLIKTPNSIVSTDETESR